MSDIDIHANRTWKYKDTYCISCKDKSKLENTKHILECKTLINENQKIIYIPTTSDLFSCDIQEQIYASNMIRENMQTRERLKPDSGPFGPCELTMLCSTCIFYAGCG